MNLGQFADHLKELMDNNPRLRSLPLYLATDAEGNDFRPFCGDFDIMLGEEIDAPVQKAAVFWPDY